MPSTLVTPSVRFDNVRVVITNPFVFVIAAHGAYLPDDLAPALDFALPHTGGADTLDEFFAEDMESGDEAALTLMYPHAPDRTPLQCSEARIVTNLEKIEPRQGDRVSWKTRAGYRTGGVVQSVSDGVAVVNSVGYVHRACGVTRVPLDRLEMAP